MKVILTKGYVAVVDDEDAWVNQWKWTAIVKSNTVYAVRYPGARGQRKRITLHGLLLPCEEGFTPDHIDGDGLNNRRSNLRPANKNQQSQNRRGSISSTSAYKGVIFIKRDNRKRRWRTDIRVGGHTKTVGYFETEVEAAMAYDKAARLYYGQYARLNFTVGCE